MNFLQIEQNNSLINIHSNFQKLAIKSISPPKIKKNHMMNKPKNPIKNKNNPSEIKHLHYYLSKDHYKYKMISWINIVENSSPTK
jgi:hypothetical protein